MEQEVNVMVCAHEGLHFRPSAAVVKLCNCFQLAKAAIVKVNDKILDPPVAANSPIGLLSQAATQCTHLCFKVEGENSKDMAVALSHLFDPKKVDVLSNPGKITPDRVSEWVAAGPVAPPDCLVLKEMRGECDLTH